MKNTVDFKKFKDDFQNLDKDFNKFSKLNHKFFRLHENLTCNFYKQIWYLLTMLKWTIEIINIRKISFKDNGRAFFAEWLRELADSIEEQR